MANPYVCAKALGVKFDSDILRNLFFDVKKGEFVSIVGKSGVGKSTLLNALAGLVDFEGFVKKPEKVSFVFQDNSLFPWMNVEDNIAFALDKKDSKIIEKIIEVTGLNGKENNFPHELSGGQQQRVSIGRALAFNPDLLLLDEPFASLDSFTRSSMQDWINATLFKNKTTTILVTHDIDEAILLSDRILVLKNQRLENEFVVPFNKPRNSEIRYTNQFQELKKEIYGKY